MDMGPLIFVFMTVTQYVPLKVQRKIKSCFSSVKYQLLLIQSQTIPLTSVRSRAMVTAQLPPFSKLEQLSCLLSCSLAAWTT